MSETSNWQARWREVVAELEQERDELRVKMHLAKQDAKDELAKLEGKIDELRARAAAFDKEGDGYMDDVGDLAKNVAGEIREGFQKLRSLF